MEYLVLWILCGVAGMIILQNKGRGGCAGFLLGLLLGPIGIVIALVMGRNSDKLENEAMGSGNVRRCPWCAELIRIEAIACKHCGRDVPPRL